MGSLSAWHAGGGANEGKVHSCPRRGGRGRIGMWGTSWAGARRASGLSAQTRGRTCWRTTRIQRLRNFQFLSIMPRYIFTLYCDQASGNQLRLTFYAFKIEKRNVIEKMIL